MAPGGSSPMTMKRITREIADLKKEDLGPIVLEPTDNLSIWRGSIPGPQGSVYEGGTFNVEIVLPTDYPFSAPKVIFKTRIYHMNISEQGNICIDILKQNWSPALSLFKVMLSLSSLLTDPNPKDPLVPSIAMQYLRNRKEHDATARQWTHSFAVVKPPPPVVQPPSPKTGKGKGKKRSESGPSNAAGSSSSNTRSGQAGSSMATEVIDLNSDSEDDEEAKRSSDVKGKKRKRAEGTASVNSEEVILLSDEEDEEERNDVPAKKTRAQRKPPSRAGRGTTAAGGSRRSARHRDREEVIVVEDEDN